MMTRKSLFFTSLLSTPLYAKDMVTLKYAEIACENNNPTGYTDLGSMYMIGVGVDINTNKAI